MLKQNLRDLVSLIPNSILFNIRYENLNLSFLLKQNKTIFEKQKTKKVKKKNYLFLLICLASMNIFSLIRPSRPGRSSVWLSDFGYVRVCISQRWAVTLARVSITVMPPCFLSLDTSLAIKTVISKVSIPVSISRF